MSLFFLNPWFWLGALAIAAPLYLHLRRKKETNVLQFSALRFLDDAPEPRRSPLRLRDVLLFALRVLALLGLVGAFAWPYVSRTSAPVVAESRVYILDNTLSHQANDGFIRDRERIATELARAGSDVQLAVVELTAQPRLVAAFGDDRESARQKVQALRPSFQRGSYLAAFRLANTVLGNSLGQRKRIVLCGDNQENQWTESASTPPFLRQVEIALPQTGAAALPNLALAEPLVQRIFLGDKSLVSFTVQLAHSAEVKAASGPEGPAARRANVVLRVNDQIIFNRALDLQDQPETLRLQAQWEADPALWLHGEVSVAGAPDALAGDNRVFFALPPVKEGKVALLARSLYLRLALSPDVMRGQWATRVLEPAELSAELAARDDADVLVMESNYLQSSDARKLLWRYLSNGRGAVLLVNRLTPTITGCLRELGFEAEGSVELTRRKAGRFQFVLPNHPVFYPFLAPEYGNLMEIRMFKRARLKTTQAMPLIFAEDGSAVFFQSTKLQGNLFVAAFGLDREHTSWPIHPTFIPFLDLLLQAARAEDPTPTNFQPGEIALVQLPSGAAASEVVLRDGQKECARAPVEQGRAHVRLPDRPGLYALSYDSSAEAQKVFGVNPSPKESRLTFVELPDAIKSWQMPRATPAVRAASEPATAQLSLAGILRQRIWWWMLLAGLAALLLEPALAERRKERA